MKKTSRRQQAAETSRDGILDAAEKFFSEQGFDESRCGRLRRRPGLDVAMINYYFGSKSGLYRAVFERRIKDLTQRRLGGLERLISASAGGAPKLEDIVYALVKPNIRLRSHPELGGVPFGRLIVREIHRSQRA